MAPVRLGCVRSPLVNVRGHVECVRDPSPWSSTDESHRRREEHGDELYLQFHRGGRRTCVIAFLTLVTVSDAMALHCDFRIGDGLLVGRVLIDGRFEFRAEENDAYPQRTRA